MPNIQDFYLKKYTEQQQKLNQIAGLSYTEIMQEMYQTIFDTIQDCIPYDWNKIILYTSHVEDSSTVKIFINNDGNYVESFDYFKQNNSNDDMLDSKILNLAVLMDVNFYRKSVSDKNKWTILTFMVDSNGNMKADYIYKQVNEDNFDISKFEQSWKKRYLK